MIISAAKQGTAALVWRARCLVVCQADPRRSIRALLKHSNDLLGALRLRAVGVGNVLGEAGLSMLL